ncbi:MAG: hypothetical protein GXO04_02350 [Aquificae bacterium]|nr:hypothetical protein [Aquificota bacterium]
MKLLLLGFLFLVGCEKAQEVFVREELLNRPPSESCSECHSRIYDDWTKSRHFFAWVSENFRKESENYTKLKCLPCHAPLQVDELKKPELRREHRSEGVNCVACHFKEETRAMHGPYDVWSPPHPSRRDESYVRAGFCAGCHRETYKEWREARSEKSCQSCHMRVVDYTWIVDKFPFFLLHSRKALHDHSFPSLKAGKRDIKVFFRDGKLEIVNVGIPHNVPTADQGNPRLYVSVRVLYEDGKEREIRRVLSPSSGNALVYLRPYSIRIPNPEGVKGIEVRIERRLAWKRVREKVYEEVILPVRTP